MVFQACTNVTGKSGVGVDSSNRPDSGEMKEVCDRTVVQGGGSGGCQLL